MTLVISPIIYASSLNPNFFFFFSFLKRVVLSLSSPRRRVIEWHATNACFVVHRHRLWFDLPVWFVMDGWITSRDPVLSEDNLVAQAGSAGRRVALSGDDTWMELFQRAHFAGGAEPYPSFNVKAGTCLSTIDTTSHI